MIESQQGPSGVDTSDLGFSAFWGHVSVEGIFLSVLYNAWWSILGRVCYFRPTTASSCGNLSDVTNMSEKCWSGERGGGGERVVRCDAMFSDFRRDVVCGSIIFAALAPLKKGKTSSGRFPEKYQKIRNFSSTSRKLIV